MAGKEGRDQVGGHGLSPEGSVGPWKSPKKGNSESDLHCEDGEVRGEVREEQQVWGYNFASRGSFRGGSGSSRFWAQSVR